MCEHALYSGRCCVGQIYSGGFSVVFIVLFSCEREVAALQ